jgi:hypothetical protein
MIVILHEEPVALHHMVIKIPSESLIKNSRNTSKYWRNDTRLEIRPYARLGKYKNTGEKKTGHILGNKTAGHPHSLSSKVNTI